MLELTFTDSNLERFAYDGHDLGLSADAASFLRDAIQFMRATSSPHDLRMSWLGLEELDVAGGNQGWVSSGAVRMRYRYTASHIELSLEEDQ